MWPLNAIYLFRLTLLLTTLTSASDQARLSAAPSICTDLHSQPVPDRLTGISIQSHPGDATITLLTNEPLPLADINLSALNDMLAESNVSLGLRILHVPNPLNSSLHELLLREVQYLQQCTASPIAILVLHEMWPLVVDMADDIEYNIWRLPPAARLLFVKVAHMLYELPWNGLSNNNGTVAEAVLSVHAADVSTEDAFVAAARAEHLCLTPAHSWDSHGEYYGMQIVLGSEIVAVQNRLQLTAEDDLSVGSNRLIIVAVPLVVEDNALVTNLPTGSYAISEYDHSTSRVSLVLTITAVLSQLSKLLHQSVRDCNTTAAQYSPTDPIAGDSHLSCKHPENWNLDTVATLSAHDLYAEIADAALNIEPIVVLRRRIANAAPSVAGVPQHEMRRIATIDCVSNITTFFNYSDQPAPQTGDPTLGTQFQCANGSKGSRGDSTVHIYTDANISSELYWRIRPEIWVAIGLTLAVLGILISFAIFVFVLVRLYMEDVLEGNPVGTIALLIALIALFASFVPFCLEYTFDRHIVNASLMSAPPTPVALCAVRIVLVMLGYCFPFALLLCRTMMLASIGSEGGFLSHVNGYVQSVICVFSALVQIGMSVQLVVLVIGYQESMSCDAFYYGAWFWVLLAYDGFLLGLMLVLAPFCVRSQRNYREGLLIALGAVLCVAVWCAWIPLANVDREWRDAAIPLGMQATGWAILGAILVPRSFLIVRGIARSDMAQALPSLASLAFAHNSQCLSEQSIYECVNPAMRQQTHPNGAGSGAVRGGGGGDVGGGGIISAVHRQQDQDDDDYDGYDYSDRYQSPSEIPTLPLRGASRKTRNMLDYASSQQSTMPPASPNKATRF